MKNKYYRAVKLLLIIAFSLTMPVFFGGASSHPAIYAESYTGPLSFALPVYAYSMFEQGRSLAPDDFQEASPTLEPEPEPKPQAEITEEKAVIPIPKTDKVVYLTFDDGPCETGITHNTIYILDLLAEYTLKRHFSCLEQTQKNILTLYFGNLTKDTK